MQEDSSSSGCGSGTCSQTSAPSGLPNPTQPPPCATQRGGGPATFSHLPPELQSRVFAHAGAPFNTCKVSAAVAIDDSLLHIWMREAEDYPDAALSTAAWGKKWDVCFLILQYWVPNDIDDRGYELGAALVCAAGAGQLELVQQLIDAGGWAHACWGPRCARDELTTQPENDGDSEGGSDVSEDGIDGLGGSDDHCDGDSDDPFAGGYFSECLVADLYDLGRPLSAASCSCRPPCPYALVGRALPQGQLPLL
jgi:hypothetical protein